MTQRKTAQKLTRYQKARRAVNFGGAALEALSPALRKVLKNMDRIDKKVREEADDLNYYLGMAKSFNRRKDYLSAASYLARFHEKARTINHELSQFDDDISKDQKNFLLKNFSGKDKATLFNYDPKKPLSGQDKSKKSTAASSVVRDWWRIPGRVSDLKSALTDRKAKGMKALEKNFKTPFIGKLRDQTLQMLDISQSYYNDLIRSFTELGVAWSTRNVGEYIREVQKLNESYVPYHKSYLEYHDTNIVPLQAEQKKLDNKNPFDDDQPEESEEKKEPGVIQKVWDKINEPIGSHPDKDFLKPGLGRKNQWMEPPAAFVNAPKGAAPIATTPSVPDTTRDAPRLPEVPELGPSSRRARQSAPVSEAPLSSEDVSLTSLNRRPSVRLPDTEFPSMDVPMSSLRRQRTAPMLHLEAPEIPGTAPMRQVDTAPMAHAPRKETAPLTMRSPRMEDRVTPALSNPFGETPSYRLPRTPEPFAKSPSFRPGPTTRSFEDNGPATQRSRSIMPDQASPSTTRPQGPISGRRTTFLAPPPLPGVTRTVSIPKAGPINFNNLNGVPTKRQNFEPTAHEDFLGKIEKMASEEEIAEAILAYSAIMEKQNRKDESLRLLAVAEGLRTKSAQMAVKKKVLTTPKTLREPTLIPATDVDETDPEDTPDTLPVGEKVPDSIDKITPVDRTRPVQHGIPQGEFKPEERKRWRDFDFLAQIPISKIRVSQNTVKAIYEKLTKYLHHNYIPYENVHNLQDGLILGIKKNLPRGKLISNLNCQDKNSPRDCELRVLTNIPSLDYIDPFLEPYEIRFIVSLRLAVMGGDITLGNIHGIEVVDHSEENWEEDRD